MKATKLPQKLFSTKTDKKTVMDGAHNIYSYEQAEINDYFRCQFYIFTIKSKPDFQTHNNDVDIIGTLNVSFRIK